MIYIGDNKIGAINVGDVAVDACMMGDAKVFPNSPDIVLPTGYTLLQYVSTTNNGGYIDADILPSDDLGYSVTYSCHVVASRDQAIFGCKNDSGNTRYSFGVYNERVNIGWNTSQIQSYNLFNLVADQWYTMYVNWNNDRAIRFDGNQNTSTVSGTLGTFTRNICLLGYNNNGTITGRECSLKRVTFTRGTTIIADFVPCKDPNNEIGMYDLVRERFFGSGNATPLIEGV